MRRTHLPLLLCTLIAVLATAPSANAAYRPVTGTLSSTAPYTVVALSPTGSATTARTVRGRFSVVPPSSTFTLHLRLRGDYRGPIVLRRIGTDKVVLGAKPGVRLGAIRVYGTWGLVTSRLPLTAMDSRRVAAAYRGVPTGATNLGRVNMRRFKFKGLRLLPTTAGPGGDSDLDGLPDAMDVDDDGDLQLDNVDATDGLSKGPAQPGKGEFWTFSNFKLPIDQTINLHVGGLTKAAIDDTMKRTVTLAIQRVDGDSVELDCGGLTYCSKGGTGLADWSFAGMGGAVSGKEFPEEYDADGDGLGSIEKGSTGDFQLFTGATSSQIGAGDMFLEHATTGSTTVRYTGMLNYMFNTVPALKSWQSTGGQSGTMTYPVASNGPGTQQDPFEVSADASGDVILTFTAWRPQRSAFRGEASTSGWVDIGRMYYQTWFFVDRPGAGPGAPPTQKGGGECPTNAYSESDAQLSVAGANMGVLDSAPDRAANSANTFTYTVNLSECARSKGTTIDSGDRFTVNFEARSRYGDNAGQNTTFERT